MSDSYPYLDRELSWLSFNERVLQEADDPSVPLFERLNFLAIYSSNLDEFFRVRVASLRSLLRLKKKSIKALDVNPSRLLKHIHRVVSDQQDRFGTILRHRLLPELEAHGIFLITETRLTDEQAAFARTYFDERVRPVLQTFRLDDPKQAPFLKNKGLYLVAELWPRSDRHSLTVQPLHYGLLNIPSPPLPRFLEVPGPDGGRYVMFLDDVIRCNIGALFPGFDVGAAYAVKLTRDADLYLEDEFSGDLVEMIRKSLSKRETGLPSRFLYDGRAPYALIAHLKRCFDLDNDDIVLGGRYHNLNDLFTFPRFGLDRLANEPLPPLPVPWLASGASVFEAVAQADRLLHLPYQAYDPVLRFLREAADDPMVTHLWITLYRVASDSAVAQALIRASEQGTSVTAFVEVKARFDEAPNLFWAERMEAAGVRVLYSLPGLKVHAKLGLAARREDDAVRFYAYLSTGNFNEKTARLYADHGLFTADPRLTSDVRRVFDLLETPGQPPAFEHLLVAPDTLRDELCRLIDFEAAEARAGRPAWMVLKMNSLEDEGMMASLYEAGLAGVRIELIVRGICRLVPGMEDHNPRLHAFSIVDRFLEHARVFVFHHGGANRLYLSSADWMTRNLDRRVEVAFPIYDGPAHREILHLLDLQRHDNRKARVLDAGQQNTYRRAPDADAVRAQTDTYAWLKHRAAHRVALPPQPALASADRSGDSHQ